MTIMVLLFSGFPSHAFRAESGYAMVRTPAENEAFVREHWGRVWINTENRLEQIRQVEEEILFLGADLIDCEGIPDMVAVIKRILTREQAALVELKRGMTWQEK